MQKVIQLWLCLLLYSPASAFSVEASSRNDHKVIMQITDAGLIPDRFVLPQRDASVFFFNGTDNLDVGVEIEFGRNRLHCHSPQLTLNDQGVLKSKGTIVPNSFVVACFPDKGSYPLVVRAGGKRHIGTVVVK